MTVTSLPVRDEFTGSAGQVTFNYTFLIFTANDLNVYITPAGQDAKDSTDLTTAYTVNPGTIGNPVGGLITLNSGVSAGDLVTIVSSIVEDRTTDYQNSGDFLPDTVNEDFDRVVSLTKQTSDRAGRTLAFEESVQNASDLTLPTPDGGLYLRWKLDETGVENAGAPGAVIPADPEFTVASMKANTLLTIGLTVQTQGYYLAGDGAGQTYLIVASQAADGFGDHTLANGNVAVLQFDSDIRTPEMYGATGDGDTINNVVDDLALAAMFTAAPNGSVIRPGAPGRVYVLSTRQVYDGRYFDLALSLKAKQATYWDFILFQSTGDPLPWFKLGGTLDGNKTEQWFLPAPDIATLDENGAPYGKAYADPTIDFHTPSGHTGFTTATYDSEARTDYSQGNRGIVTVSNVDHFIGDNIEYIDIVWQGIVVQQVQKSCITRGSRGDGMILGNFGEMAAAADYVDGGFELAYEKVVLFPLADDGEDDPDFNGNLSPDEITVKQLDAHFGDCAYAFFFRTNNPKVEYPLINCEVNTTIRNCSRQGIWFEVPGHIDATIDTTGEYKILHPFRGSDGGCFIGNKVRSGTIRGRIVNGDVNANQHQWGVNINCENLTVLQTSQTSGNPAINNVDRATNCYVKAFGPGILANHISDCAIPESSGNAINASKTARGNTIGVKRYEEMSQVFTATSLQKDFVLSSAQDVYQPSINPEGFIRVVRKSAGFEVGTPHEIDDSSFNVSGSGSGTTIATTFRAIAGDKVTVFWTEVHTTTLPSSTGTTFTIALVDAWEDLGITIDATPLTRSRVGTVLSAGEYTVSRNSSNQIEVELGTALTGTETFEGKALPKIVQTAGLVKLSANCKSSENTIIGTGYTVGGEPNINGDSVTDCPLDIAMTVDDECNLTTDDLTFRRVWGLPVSISDEDILHEAIFQGTRAFDCNMRGDTTDIGRNAIFGRGDNLGLITGQLHVNGGIVEDTGNIALTQESKAVVTTRNTIPYRTISGVKHRGYALTAGGANQQGIDATNMDIGATPITPSSTSYT